MYALLLVIIIGEYVWGIRKFCGSFKSIVSKSQKYLWVKMSPELMSNMINTTINKDMNAD